MINSRLDDLYRGLLWIAGFAVLVLTVVIATQSASYSDGLTLSLVLAGAFFVICGLTAWIGVSLRKKQTLHMGDNYVLGTSLRQGVIAGSTVVILLILQLLRVISYIDAVLLLGLAIVLELFLGSRKAVS